MRLTCNLLCVVVLCSALAAEASAEKISPVKDNWMSSCSSSCTTNFGSDVEVRVRTSWWGSAGNKEPKNFRTLLEFDVSGIAGASDVVSATLGLYYFNNSTPQHNDPVGRTYDVHRVTQTWAENDSTWRAWDNYNTADPDNWASYIAGVPAYQPGGGDFAATVYASAVVPASTGQWMTWDVTNLVKEWVDGGDYSNNGLIIMDDNEIEDASYGKLSYLARFRSGDFHDSGYHPYLELTYVPEPASVGLFGLVFGAGVLLRRRMR